MDQDLNLNVKVNTSDAIRGLNDLKGAADQAAESVDKIGQKAEETAGKVDKVGDAADNSLPKVQGLGSAFEGVFSNALQGASQLGGNIGEISKSVSKAIPVVKNLNNTALRGLRGIRAALAATGIGIFITAIGLITTHWEGFLKAVGSSKEKFQEFKDKAIEVLGNVVAGIVGVGNVILQRLIEPVRTAIRAFTGLGNIIRDVFTGQWSKIKSDAKDAIDSIKESWSSSWDIQGNYKKGQEAGQKFVQGVTTMLTYKSPEVEKAGEKVGKALSKGIEKEIEDPYKKLIDSYRKVTSEADKLNENLEEEYKITEEIANARKLFKGSNASSFLKDADYENLAKSKVALEGYIELIDEAIEEANKLEGPDRVKELSKWEALRTRVIEKATKEQFSILEGAASKANDVRYKSFNDWISLIQESIGLKGTQVFEGYGETVEVSARGARQANELWYQLEDERLVANKKFLEDLLAQTQEGTDRYEELQNEIALLDQERTLNAAKAHDQRVKDIAEEVQTYAEAAQSIAGIFGTIADAEEDRIRRQLESGEISEEQAEEQFETVKKWQLAENWINTLGGMTAALTAPIMQNAGPAGWIAAAAQAAALLANGIAQSIKIKNTKFGDTGGAGGSGGGAPNVGVTPIEVTDDIQASPSVLQDTQTAKDQRVWILQSDLEDSHRQVEIRESNSTF